MPLLSLLPGMPRNGYDSTLIVARACALNVSCCCGRPAAFFPPLPATPPNCLPRAPLSSLHCCRSIPVDFIEREKEYVLRADIPGVHKVGAGGCAGGCCARCAVLPAESSKRTRWVLRCAEHALPPPQGMLLSSRACALKPYTLQHKQMPPRPLTPPLPLHPLTHRRRLRLQSEIRVSVEGNVVRFGHQAHPDREQKDEKEEGIFHRSERVRWGAASTAGFSRFPQRHSRTHAHTQALMPAAYVALPWRASHTPAPHPTPRLPSAAPSEAVPCACPTTPTWKPSRPR